MRHKLARLSPVSLPVWLLGAGVVCYFLPHTSDPDSYAIQAAALLVWSAPFFAYLLWALRVQARPTDSEQTEDV